MVHTLIDDECLLPNIVLIVLIEVNDSAERIECRLDGWRSGRLDISPVTRRTKISNISEYSSREGELQIYGDIPLSVPLIYLTF